MMCPAPQVKDGVVARTRGAMHISGISETLVQTPATGPSRILARLWFKSSALNSSAHAALGERAHVRM